jgi:hypothetical protein
MGVRCVPSRFRCWHPPLNTHLPHSTYPTLLPRPCTGHSHTYLHLGSCRHLTPCPHPSTPTQPLPVV